MVFFNNNFRHLKSFIISNISSKLFQMITVNNKRFFGFLSFIIFPPYFYKLIAFQSYIRPIVSSTSSKSYQKPINYYFFLFNTECLGVRVNAKF